MKIGPILKRKLYGAHADSYMEWCQNTHVGTFVKSFLLFGKKIQSNGQAFRKGNFFTAFRNTVKSKTGIYLREVGKKKWAYFEMCMLLLLSSTPWWLKPTDISNFARWPTYQINWSFVLLISINLLFTAKSIKWTNDIKLLLKSYIPYMTTIKINPPLGKNQQLNKYIYVKKINK